MAMFCWHHWEVPSYVEALNLREGLKKCQKCGSIKGFKRFVPIEYDMIKKADDTIPDNAPFSLMPVVSGVVMVVIALIVATTLLPIVMKQVGSVQDSTDKNADPSTSQATNALLGLIPMMIIIPIVISAIAFLLKGVRGLSGLSEDEEDDDFDDSPPAREERRRADKPIYRDSRFTVNGRKVK